MANEPTSIIRARRLRERRSKRVIMVAPVEIGMGGVELLIDNGLLKHHQMNDRSTVGEACPAALVQWAVVRGPGVRVSPSDKDRQLFLKAQPCERKDLLVNQANFAALTKAGHATRFGPYWPGQRYLAKTRRGIPCQNPAIRGQGRCKLHGGKSTGPRTAEGKALSIAAHTKHGLRDSGFAVVG
jgi:hypothetical protein